MNEKGFFHAVSTGPGDPENLTVHAIEVLKKCPVIAFPVTASNKKAHIALDSIKPYVDVDKKLLLPVEFSMKAKEENEAYENIFAEIKKYLDQNLHVAFLSIGDVSLYASGGHLTGIAKKNGYETAAVPGVSSVNAAACACALELAGSESCVTIIPGDSYYKKNKISSAIKGEGTKVFMKCGKFLGEILDEVLKSADSRKVFLVYRCSMPEQKIFTGIDLHSIPQEIFLNSYLSILIVLEA